MGIVKKQSELKMKNFIYILLIFHITSLEVIAQTKSDSLYILKIDSIIQSKNHKDYWGTELMQKQIEDSTDFKTVIGRWKNGDIVDISNFHSFGGCERTTFHLIANELVMVNYEIVDPDVYSEGPPKITYKVYFRDKKVIIMQLSSNYIDGLRFCTSYDIKKKDFLKELIYYRQLLLNN